MNKDEISKRVSEIFALHTKPDELLDRVRGDDPVVISALMGKLASTGETGERLKAIRDACHAILNEKLTARTIATMEKLDGSASRLTWVGIILAFVAVIPILASVVKWIISSWR